MASQLYTIDKSEFGIRMFKKYAKKKNFKYNNPTFNEMLMAPFDLEEIKKPFVLSFIAAGILDAIISYSIAPKNKKVTDINNVYAYGSKFNAITGSSLYTLTSGAFSYGAGVSEEMFMRGLLLPMFDIKYGQTTGLIATSLLFSAAHIPSYLKINSTKLLLYSIAEITAAGFAFGINTQRNDYNIKTVIAAHAWFDLMVTITSWLLNPEENPIGFSVSFKI